MKLTKKMKRWLLAGAMLSTTLFLSGCIRLDEAGEPQGPFSELMNNWLVIPTQQLLEWLGEFLGSYGLAIIVLTVVIRVIILPIGLKQQRNMMESQMKMAAIKPVTDEIQAEMKETNDPTEKQELQAELMEVYKENDINMFAQLSGCLPMLVQMPVFLAMFFAVQHSAAIANATWLGIPLGERNLLLAILTGLVHFAHGKFMHTGMSGADSDQKQPGGSMMTLTMPVMLFFFAWQSNAGLALYWLVGGFVQVGQSLLTNLYYKPKIEAELESKHGEQKVVKRKRPAKKKQPVDQSQPTPAPSARERRNNSPFENKGRRNEGKQQRK
jgi:YidC/Oxa1 family membrane protein insertase